MSRNRSGLLCVALLAATMVMAILVPSQADASEYYYNSGSTPCPHYSIQDVLDDLHGDWDKDGVTNGDEIYKATLNPCMHDSSKWCKLNSGCYAYKTTYYYVYQPATTHRVRTHNTHYVYHAPANPCTSGHYSWSHVNANPHGDWDHDGVSNYTEVHRGANPCAKPCPNPSNLDIALNPGADWDRDGHSNRVEATYGTNPCSSHYYPVVQRLPHVNNTNVHHDVPRLPHITQPLCPAAYPYYSSKTGLCYANPGPANTGW